MRQKRTSPASRLTLIGRGVTLSGKCAVLAGLYRAATGFVWELAILSGRQSARGRPGERESGSPRGLGLDYEFR